MEANRFICVFVLTGGAMAYAQQPSPPPVKITLEQALELAARHNHSLKAIRTTVSQSQADEVTANLRPNPSLACLSQHIPFFQLSQQDTADHFTNTPLFDLDIR